MKKVKAIVVEYNNGVETGHRKYKSLTEAWMDAERKNTTDPLCLKRQRFFRVIDIRKEKK